jgi:hypothetical protein
MSDENSRMSDQPRGTGLTRREVVGRAAVLARFRQYVGDQALSPNAVHRERSAL